MLAKKMGLLAKLSNSPDDDIDDEDGYHKTMEIAQIGLPERDRDGYIEKLSGWLQANFRKTQRL